MYYWETSNDGISTQPEISIGAVLFTEQNINTLTDAEILFSSYKETLWETMNTLPYWSVHRTPIYDAMLVESFDGSISNEAFSGNFGIINFMMTLPYTDVGDDYKIENGKVLIHYCEWGNVAPATRVGETEVCPSENMAWKEAPFVKFWTNEMGVIFARGISFTSYEIQITPLQPVYTKVGDEIDITLTITPNMDINNYDITLILPPEIELISGDSTWSGNLKTSEDTNIVWKIKATSVGNYQIQMEGVNLKAYYEIRVEQPSEGTGV